MNMVIVPGAKELIMQEGGIVSVRLEQRLAPNCCNSPQITPAPSVKLGKPAEHELSDYQAFEIDDVTVYAHTSIQNYNNEIVLRIGTETTLFGIRLILYGMPTPAKGCGNCTFC